MYRVLTSVEALPELEQLLHRRTALGLDHRDEMWEGVLHMNPPAAGGPHQLLATRLSGALLRAADAAGLLLAHESGLFDVQDPDNRWRVPDLLIARPECWTERGVEGPAVLVVEILSPRDESYAKLPFYAEMRVEQVLIIDPRDLSFVLHRLTGPAYTVVDDGRLDALDAVLTRTVDANGPMLVLTVGVNRTEFRPWRTAGSRPDGP
jgi:Uma2 family endonuclease